MPNFPARDLTNQYISKSYQDVVQQYVPGGATNYLLDGYGNSILSIPLTSYGNQVLTIDQTSSYANQANLANVASVADVALIADSAVSSSYSETSSYVLIAISASWAPGVSGGETTLYTGSTYQITSSVSLKAISASYAPFTQTIQTTVASASWVSASVKITTADTASYYGGSVVSASYAPTDVGYSASVSSYITTKQNTLVNGTTYTITSSWASNTISSSFASVARSASYAPSSPSVSASYSDVARSASYAPFTQTYQVSGSWASSSISASFAPTNTAFSTSVENYIETKQDILVTGNTYTITSSWASRAVSSSYSPVEVGYSASVSTQFETKQNTLVTGTTYPVTASWAINVVNGAVPDYTSSLFGTASWASWASNATQALTASYVTGSKFSRGGTIYNPSGITAAASIIVWEAPVNCFVTNVRGYRVAGTSASINARKNGTDNHLASDLSLTTTGSWTDGGAVQNNTYVVGDKMEIMLTAVGGSPTQIAIQVNFTK